MIENLVESNAKNAFVTKKTNKIEHASLLGRVNTLRSRQILLHQREVSCCFFNVQQNLCSRCLLLKSKARAVARADCRRRDQRRSFCFRSDRRPKSRHRCAPVSRHFASGGFVACARRAGVQRAAHTAAARLRCLGNGCGSRWRGEGAGRRAVGSGFAR